MNNSEYELKRVSMFLTRINRFGHIPVFQSYFYFSDILYTSLLAFQEGLEKSNPNTAHWDKLINKVLETLISFNNQLSYHLGQFESSPLFNYGQLYGTLTTAISSLRVSIELQGVNQPDLIEVLDTVDKVLSERMKDTIYDILEYHDKEGWK